MLTDSNKGPSSNIAFLRHISFAVARVDAPHISTPVSTRQITGTMSISRLRHAPEKGGNHALNIKRTTVNIYALPSEERASTLIKEYFQKTGRLLPFVHERSFHETYFQLKQNNFTLARRTWLGLLNIIFAMATTLLIDGGSAEERVEESEVYYQRAVALCDKEAKCNSSLELGALCEPLPLNAWLTSLQVQYLLVLGQYLQGTQKSVQAWTVHGLAITTAIQLGLHSPRTNSGFSTLDAETRKRVWYGCILLDR
jgi:hypothetical protein